MKRMIATTVLLAAVVAWPAAAQTSQPVVNVQIINVCDDNGNNCALSGPYASYGYSPAAITTIFKQAGITVNLLAPVQYDNSAYLNPAVIDDPTHGYLTGSPTDAAHQLLDLPGHMQNTDSQVLNVFAVNTLPHTTSTGATASQLFGLGLENANGAVVTTGLLSGSDVVAGIDNIAHELGHNLGLLHVDTTPDTSPYNLMQGSGRSVPYTLCGISGVVCDAHGNIVPAGDATAATTGLKDNLLPSQVSQIQQTASNLFSVDMASAEVTSGSGCISGSYYCGMDIALPPSTSTQSLLGLKVRFLDQPGATSTVPVNGFISQQSLAPGCTWHDTTGGNLAYGQWQGISASLPNGGTELSTTFDPNCLTPGTTASIFTGIGQQDGSVLDLQPFSVEFDFSNGVTSTALFDETGTASSTSPIALSVAGVDPSGPGLAVPTDPALFNALSVVEDEGGVIPDVVAVPEATSAALLAGQMAAGLLVLGLAGRRRLL